MFSDFSCPLVGETDIQPLSTRKKIYFKGVIIEGEGAVI